MHALIKIVAATACGLCLGAPTLDASASGTNTGGVNSGGLTTSGGTTATPVSTAPCATISTWNMIAGYRPGDVNIGAIWNEFAVKNCANVAETLKVTFTEAPVGTDVSMANPSTVSVLAGQQYGMKWDNDYATLSTTYLIQLTVTDSVGNVLAYRSQLVTTPGIKIA